MFTQLLNAMFRPGFPARIRQIARELGWRPLEVGPLWSQFQLAHQGHPYQLWIEGGSRQVTLTVMSNGQFALKLYPPILKVVLQQRNQQRGEFTWRLFDGSRSTWASLGASIPLSDWDAEVTHEVVGEMLAEVHLYDTRLRTLGLI